MDAIFEQLSGPIGGAIAGAFGVGFGFGYGFAQKTVLKLTLERLKAAEEEVARWQAAYIKATGSGGANEQGP